MVAPSPILGDIKSLHRSGLMKFSALARSVGPATRTAIGAAADQTDAEVMRITVPPNLVGDYDMMKIVIAACRRAAVASNVGVLYNVGIVAVGGTYAASTKLYPSDDATTLASVTTAGQTRYTYQELLMIGLGAGSQETVNAQVPTAVVGPSATAVKASALLLSAGFDIVIGGRFAASAPAGDNFTITALAALPM